MTGADVRAAATWLAVSGATLAAVEGVLLLTGRTTYTETYQAVRGAHRAVSWIPVATAVVVVAHLEGWLPPRLDPLVYFGNVARKLV